MTCLYRSVQTILLGACIWTAGQAQVPAGSAEAAFETASIRPAHVTPGCFSMLPPGGTHYELTCITLRNLIGMAYSMSSSYIDGGGGALDTFYDLRATTPDQKPWTMENVRPMLQRLLAERFHLAFHAGKREISGYGMVAAKGGPKLRAVDPASIVQGQKAGESSQNFVSPGHVQGRGLNAAGIASLLSVPLGAPVADHTGIPGVFDIDLSFAPENATDSNLPSLFTAVEEELGLKLQPEKVTVSTVVIDHVDDAPTPN